MTLDETHAHDETHSNKWGVWRLAGFSSPIAHKIACSADIAISGFVVCSSERSTNQDLVAPDPRRSRASRAPALTDVRVNANVARQSSTHEMLSLHTLRSGRGQQRNGDALAKYQPQGLCERASTWRCPTKVLIAASQHACALRAAPRPWPDGSYLHFTLSICLACVVRTGHERCASCYTQG